MSKKRVEFSPETLLKLQKGVGVLAKAVKSTLGPKGRNVVIEKKFGAPHITKDGVSVAREIELSEPIENLGAQLMKTIASKTADVAGDGTTTSVVLAEAGFNEAIKNLVAGAQPVDMARGMEKAVDYVLTHLEKASKKITSNDEIQQVATISANNDEYIGGIIASAIAQVGEHGVITVEEGKTVKTEVKLVEGMEFDRGFLSPYFITDPKKQTTEFESPYILVTDKKISSLKDILPILEAVVQTGKPLLLIADEVEQEALTVLVVNKLRAGLKICAVKAPGFGDRRKAMLEDIAVLTGATLIAEEKGLKLETATLANLGSCDKLIVKKDTTVIVNGAGAKNDIAAQIAKIEAQIKNVSSEYERGKLQEQRARLAGKVAIISVGAATEVQAKEIKDRVEDSLSATRAAQEEGIVVGGGVALARACQMLAKKSQLVYANRDEELGSQIVQVMLQAPLRTILENAKGQDYHPIFHKVMEGEGSFGYNARTEAFGHLDKEGVIDPTKVTREALRNANSIVSLLMNTSCVVVDAPENNKPTPGADHHHGMGDLM